jgi:hypothetical protein
MLFTFDYILATERIPRAFQNIGRVVVVKVFFPGAAAK